MSSHFQHFPLGIRYPYCGYRAARLSPGHDPHPPVLAVGHQFDQYRNGKFNLPDLLSFSLPLTTYFRLLYGSQRKGFSSDERWH